MQLLLKIETLKLQLLLKLKLQLLHSIEVGEVAGCNELVGTVRAALFRPEEAVAIEECQAPEDESFFMALLLADLRALGVSEEPWKSRQNRDRIPDNDK